MVLPLYIRLIFTYIWYYPTNVNDNNDLENYINMIMWTDDQQANILNLKSEYYDISDVGAGVVGCERYQHKALHINIHSLAATF